MRGFLYKQLKYFQITIKIFNVQRSILGSNMDFALRNFACQHL